MQSNTNHDFWFLLIGAAATTAAGFSAWAAVSIRNLTKKLVGVTKEYAKTVREELILLQRTAEPRLFLEVGLLSGYPARCALTCIHLGADGSHPILIERVETALESVEVPGKVLASDIAQFHDVLRPGRRWYKVVSSSVGPKLDALPRPNIFQAIARWKLERSLVAYLTVSLVYSVTGEQKPPVEKQFQVIASSLGVRLEAVA